MRVRSTGRVNQPTSSPIYQRRARELRRLPFTSTDHLHTTTTLEPICRYIGTVGAKQVVPPASISISIIYRQAFCSPHAKRWRAAMLDKLQRIKTIRWPTSSLRILYLLTTSSAPNGSFKAGGRFKARLVLQGWAQRHGLACGSTFCSRLRAKKSAIATGKFPPPKTGPIQSSTSKQYFSMESYERRYFADKRLALRLRAHLQDNDM